MSSDCVDQASLRMFWSMSTPVQARYVPGRCLMAYTNASISNKLESMERWNSVMQPVKDEITKRLARSEYVTRPIPASHGLVRGHGDDVDITGGAADTGIRLGFKR